METKIIKSQNQSNNQGLFVRSSAAGVCSQFVLNSFFHLTWAVRDWGSYARFSKSPHIMLYNCINKVSLTFSWTAVLFRNIFNGTSKFGLYQLLKGKINNLFTIEMSQSVSYNIIKWVCASGCSGFVTFFATYPWDKFINDVKNINGGYLQSRQFPIRVPLINIYKILRGNAKLQYHIIKNNGFWKFDLGRTIIQSILLFTYYQYTSYLIYSKILTKDKSEYSMITKLLVSAISASVGSCPLTFVTGFFDAAYSHIRRSQQQISMLQKLKKSITSQNFKDLAIRIIKHSFWRNLSFFTGQWVLYDGCRLMLGLQTTGKGL